MSPIKQNPRLKLRCQYCNNITPTRHLDFDVVCWSCGEYAKRANQKVVSRIEDSAQYGKREVWIVV